MPRHRSTREAVAAAWRSTEFAARDQGPGQDAQRVFVVGLDASQLRGKGSHSSLHALAHAARIARRQGARIVPVWVQPPIGLAETFAETVETLVRERDERADQARCAVKEAAGILGVGVGPLLVCDGDPFEQLCSIAGAVQADAIFVGASEHRMGSLAARLIRGAGRPVTVVP